MLGWLRYHNSRDVLSTVKTVTVSPSGSKWSVSIQTEREVEHPVPKATTAVGIDMGLARFATLSDGRFLEPLSSFKTHEARLRRVQRSLSHKTAFSSNWNKAKAKVQRIHPRISNRRYDFMDKATHSISQNHAMVFIEDLQVRNMSKWAAGTTEQPGKNVRAKSGLNKSILDQSWFAFRKQLEYKLARVGGWLIAVPVACGFADNGDVVGDITILARGHRVAACGEDVSQATSARARRAASLKQDPSEATLAGLMPISAQSESPPFRTGRMSTSCANASQV